MKITSEGEDSNDGPRDREPGFNRHYIGGWVDHLVERSRIMGEARMLRDEEPVTDEARKLIVQRLEALLGRLEKPTSWAAKSIGMSPTVLSQVCSGNYAADDEPHIRKIDKWIEQQVLREAAPKPEGFVRLKVVEKIYGVARYACDNNTITVVHGPAGVGKTMTLKAIRAEMPGSVYLSVTTCGQSKLAVFDALSNAVSGGGLKLTSYEAEKHLIRALAGSNRLIIIDEIHKLVEKRRDEGLHALRDLHDNTGCPMIWAGMTNFATYVQTGKVRNGGEPLDQVDSRVKLWLNLTDQIEGRDGGKDGLYTEADIRKFINRYKVRVAPDGISWLHALSNTPRMGALRRLDSILRAAATIVAAKGDLLFTASMLRSVWTEQLGKRMADQYEREIEAWSERRMAVG